MLLEAIWSLSFLLSPSFQIFLKMEFLGQREAVFLLFFLCLAKAGFSLIRTALWSSATSPWRRLFLCLKHAGEEKWMTGLTYKSLIMSEAEHFSIVCLLLLAWVPSEGSPLWRKSRKWWSLSPPSKLGIWLHLWHSDAGTRNGLNIK